MGGLARERAIYKIADRESWHEQYSKLCVLRRCFLATTIWASIFIEACCLKFQGYTRVVKSSKSVAYEKYDHKPGTGVISVCLGEQGLRPVYKETFG